MKYIFTFVSLILITQSVFADMTCDTDISKYFAVYEIDTYNCASGYYLPANTDGCQICTYGHSCPGGTYTFNETEDQGLTIGTYTCNSGCFLPANSDTCRACPTGWTCPGGTFTFNTDKFQGLGSGNITTNTMNNICATNFPEKLRVVYEPNQHNCSAGYYLPANVDECRKCLNDHYCPGGNLTFNETTPQGIISCPENHPYAPAGMWLESQCGRKLHVGEDILYMHQSPANPTMHRLFIKYENTVYSVNAIPVMVGENNPKMSATATHELRATIGEYIYTICDDSVPQCQNKQ